MEVLYKVTRGGYNIEIYFKQFFTCLERTSTFINSVFRAIYKSSSRYVLSEKSVLLQIRSIFTEEYPCRVVISIKLKSRLNIPRTPFLKSTPGWLLLFSWKWIRYPFASIHLFRVKIEKLGQGVDYFQS